MPLHLKVNVTVQIAQFTTAKREPRSPVICCGVDDQTGKCLWRSPLLCCVWCMMSSEHHTQITEHYGELSWWAPIFWLNTGHRYHQTEDYLLYNRLEKISNYQLTSPAYHVPWRPECSKSWDHLAELLIYCIIWDIYSDYCSWIINHRTATVDTESFKVVKACLV